MRPIEQLKNYIGSFQNEPGSKIGMYESSKMKTVYAGPKYGTVSEEEYNQLLQKGKLGRGQQTAEKLGSDALNLVGKGFEAWEENVGVHIPDISDIEVSEDIQEGFTTAKDFAGTAYNRTLKAPVEKGLALLDVPIQATQKLTRHIDPTGRGIGTGPLTIAELALTVGAGTIKKGSKKLLQTGMRQGDEAVQVVTKSLTKPQLQPIGVGTDLGNITTNPNVMAYKAPHRSPAIKQLITENRSFKPKGFNTNKWDNYIAKFGSKEGALAAITKAEESAKYLKKHGSLKGNKNIFTDPISGESFLIKNKAKRGEISIGFDSLKSIEKTLANRLTGAKLNKTKIEEIGTRLGWNKAKINKYIETNEQAKRTLEALIKDLNKGEGRTMWSLGHRTAVKELPHSADRALNIELEPLVDVLTKEGRKIKGNTGRAANDELIDLFKKITNNPADLEADMIHWGDTLAGNLMPRMREINNADDFFKEIVKREDFLAKVRSHAKKNKLTLEEAANELMEPLMKQYPQQNQPTYFN